MGFFGFGKRANSGAGQAPNPVAQAWDMSGMQMGGMQTERLDDNEQTERENAEAKRQQRKIMAALCQGGGQVNRGMIAMHDIELSQNAEDRVHEMIRSGEVGDREYAILLGSIKDPITRDGEGEVMRGMSDKHELRILGYMVKGGDGFNHYDGMGTKELAGFRAKYPLPMDFEEASKEFIDKIGAVNTDQKRREYEEAMQQFKLRVYGKRQEYWDQIKAIRDEALKPQAMGKLGRAALDTTYGFGDSMTGIDSETGRMVQIGDRDDTYGSARGGIERERSAEWEPGVAEAKQVSKAQVLQGMVTRQSVLGGLWASDSCEDSVMVMGGKQIYGVYDGAGGVEGGRNAAYQAAEVTEELCTKYDLQSGEHVAWVLNEASKAVEHNPQAGVATAVLARVIERGGRKQLAWASAGDSRIYVVRNGKAQMITRDEGEGKYITNALGRELRNGENCVRQFGEVDLQPGDRIVLCTDGVTGDYGTDLMGDEELADLVTRAQSAREAAANLVGMARKKDDRTAVVFGV